MSPETAPTVAVIGGGLSGALVAERLLRSTARLLHVVVVERRETIGAGFAYSTDHPEHVLNVPSKSMSAVDGDPDHFVAWLRGEGIDDAHEWGASSDPDGFVPRGLYGAYVGRLLVDAKRKAAAGISLTHERGAATAVSVEAGGVRVTLDDGRTIQADRAVLALGNPPPANPTEGDQPFYSSPRYVRDAWDPAATRNLSPAAPVFVLGTGLTMIDVALTLDKEGHRGTIVALSTHGLLPPPHRLPHEAIPAFLDIPASARISRLVRAVRDRARAASAQGHDWRAVMDSIRPLGQSAWRSLDPAERRRFLRHVRAYWEIHRHRAAPAAFEQVTRMRGMGRLVVRAGRIAGFAERGRRVDVTFRERGLRGQKQMAQAERVINATGPEMNFRRVRDPLLRQLLHDGWCRPGPLGLGFDAAPNGAIVGADGISSPILSTLGPPLRGVLWETTAVPEIRVQAAALARRLVDELTPR